MNRPSLKEVKEHFKNALVVADAYTEEEFNIEEYDFNTIESGDSGYVKDDYIIYGKKDRGYDKILYDGKKGYAKIVTYKKPIRTNKLTELEKRVEVLEIKSVLENSKEDKELTKKMSNHTHDSFMKAIKEGKIEIPKTINVIDELKNYRPLNVGLDFGFGNDRTVIFEGGRTAGKNHFLNEMYKLQSRIEELEAENKAILAGNSGKLEVGKWYKKGKLLVLIKCIDSPGMYFKRFHCYGFNTPTGHENFCFDVNNGDYHGFTESTKSEVLESLKYEAEKRYQKGDYVNSLNNNKETLIIEPLFRCTIEEGEGLWFGGGIVFKDGVWAEKQKIISKAEAEKQLGKKTID